MNRTNLPQHSPSLSVRRKDKILVVVCHMFGSGAWWSASEIGIVDFQELLGHGFRGGDHDVDKPQPEMEDWAVGCYHGG